MQIRELNPAFHPIELAVNHIPTNHSRNLPAFKKKSQFIFLVIIMMMSTKAVVTIWELAE